jgi:hypothetical protein
MPQVRFEPTILVFKWAKTFHALDRMVTMMDDDDSNIPIFYLLLL